MSDAPQGDGGYIWASGDTIALSDSPLYSAVQGSIGIGTNSPSHMLSLDDAYDNAALRITASDFSTEFTLNGINFGNKIFRINDQDGNLVLKISQGKVRILGDLVVDGKTQIEDGLSGIGIDRVLNDLKQIVGDVG